MNSHFLALLAVCSSLMLVQSKEAQAAPAILLFGGEEHDVFLGCLNCGKYDQSSVCNEYGKYGSEYQIESIWNEYGKYGSEYSAASPWNKYGTQPPVIVDGDGNFYGYMTANEYFAKRTRIDSVNALTVLRSKMKDLQSLRDVWCNN